MALRSRIDFTPIREHRNQAHHNQLRQADTLLDPELIADPIVELDHCVDHYWDDRQPSWIGDPLMRLNWAVLEDWVHEYLAGNAEMDLENMRRLVFLFPKLPEDLPEKLVKLREQKYQTTGRKRRIQSGDRGVQATPGVRRQRYRIERGEG